jgi:eukaryotic-like serine/threonine-protein kinase
VDNLSDYRASMNATQLCPKCGAALTSDAFEGLCPACMVHVMREIPTIVAVTEKPGDRIGRYKLLQKIGAGGCGAVYMAEQEEPVRRRVALKVIKLGMDTAQVIARFEAERQALALMDHPNIAKVLDAGSTDAGRPYFVMELVRGIKITDYCDQKQLSAAERLGLFIQVCQAIQHAHQKGIIHRDIKPSNVLVTQHDGVLLPKVIDFGIAKATTDQRLTDKTLFTAFEQFVGTPAYMSPEQAEMSTLDIDTRSDIYSLGVLLYELLTGRTPFDSQQLMAAGLDAMRRTIREREPLRPSTRLTQELATIKASPPPATGTLAIPTAEEVSTDERRRLRLKEQIRRVRGDLDWIVMKCLEKDRARRYETANGLAADLKRHLNNEPVVARPPSRWYEFQKTVRRHKFGFAAAAAVIMVLGLGVLASTFQAVRAKRAERMATQEQQKTARALEAETQAKAELRIDAYFHRITLAHRELSVDNLAGALKYLEECPKDLRGWEWPFLMRLCRVEQVILRDLPEVHSVAFQPGGALIAAACGDGTVKVLDARTGSVAQTLTGHKTYVFSVAFSPDGQHLASASADRTVRLWDLATGSELFQRPGQVGDYTGMAYAVAFSPDGRLLVSGNDDGIATLWNAADGREDQRLPERHENMVGSVAFSPDGRLLATGSRGGVLRIWDAQTRKLLHTIPAHMQRIGAIAFRRDSRWLATASFDRTVRIWDPLTGKLLQTIPGHTGVLSGLAFSRDGDRLFSCGTEDKTVRVWDPVTGREILNLRGHALACQGLALSSDGFRLASAGGDGTIRIWDATGLNGDEGLGFLTREHDHEVWSVEFSPDSSRVVSGCWEGTVRLWDARTGTPVRTLSNPQDVSNVIRATFSPDGQFIAAAVMSRDRIPTVKIWETETGREAVPEIREKMSVPFCVTFDPTGRYLVREGDEHAVQVRNARNGEVVGVIGRHERQIWGMTFSPDGRRLASASNDETVRVWEWNPDRLDLEQQPKVKLPVHIRGYGNRVAFSSDGLHLATGGEAQAVKIWSVMTGTEERTLLGHTGDVFALAFSPDGRWLASAGEDTTIRIWNAKSWQPLLKLRGHIGLVGSLAFSRDSRRLASGSRDHTMKIWDTARWEEAPRQ